MGQSGVHFLLSESSKDQSGFAAESRESCVVQCGVYKFLHWFLLDLARGMHSLAGSNKHWESAASGGPISGISVALSAGAEQRVDEREKDARHPHKGTAIKQLLGEYRTCNTVQHLKKKCLESFRKIGDVNYVDSSEFMNTDEAIKMSRGLV